MATIKSESKSPIRKKPNEIYMNTIITKRVNVPIKNVNKNIKNTLEKMISSPNIFKWINFWSNNCI